ncbi:MAG: DUF1365 domain-containing protein [Phenylobacterium sp.]|jgi:uncharacterized protein|uniref:DUF1365 domain-containing protein n=1 Tax=Phenylobacterium sp. TaxID=1871053 RepID=UPI003919EE05
MGGAVYRGVVVHARTRPRRHVLRYRLAQLLVDLDELPRLQARLRLFSTDGAGLVRLRACDHLEGSDRPLAQQVRERLAAEGLDPKHLRIALLCAPAVLGGAFNPLSVYFCQDAVSGRLEALLLEVNNTFGERHAYVLRTPAEAPAGAPLELKFAKRFFVSPFLPMDLEYRIRVTAPGDDLVVAIEARDAEGVVLAASFVGRARPLTDRALLAMALAAPMPKLGVLTAIHWEALKIWLKGMRLQPRAAEAVR